MIDPKDRPRTGTLASTPREGGPILSALRRRSSIVMTRADLGFEISDVDLIQNWIWIWADCLIAARLPTWNPYKTHMGRIIRTFRAQRAIRGRQRFCADFTSMNYTSALSPTFNVFLVAVCRHEVYMGPIS